MNVQYIKIITLSLSPRQIVFKIIPARQEICPNSEDSNTIFYLLRILYSITPEMCNITIAHHCFL